MLRFFGNSSVVCNAGTWGVRACSCYEACCLRRAGIAIMETTHAEMRLVNPHLFGSVVRQPEQWFYSAVNQWCAGLGRKTGGCQRNATIASLAKARWFEPVTEPSDVKRYFWHANFQSRALGDLMAEPSWFVCTLEDGLHKVEEIVERVLNFETKVEFPHANRAHWLYLPRFKANVPWTDVRRYYVTDAAMWGRFHDAGGCLAHSDDPHIRALLELVLGRQALL